LSKKGEQSILKLKQLIARLEQEKQQARHYISAELVQIHIYNAYLEPSRLYRLFEAIESAINGNTERLFYWENSFDEDHADYVSFLATYCADSEDSSHITIEQWKNMIVGLDGLVASGVADYFGFKLLVWYLMFNYSRHWNRYESTERYTGPWNNKFSNPVLVIGSPYTPFSPLKGSRQINSIMKSKYSNNSNIIIRNGFGLNSLSQDNTCLRYFVRDYFFKGKVPLDETICESDEMSIIEFSYNSIDKDNIF
jgi:hypothetical protein